MSLDVHSAIISTAKVEIQTLTLNGKQVTQAVFKQIQEWPLIALTAWDGVKLRGQAMGWVNYHQRSVCVERINQTTTRRLDCDSPYDAHVHIIWQFDGRLYRAIEGPCLWQNRFEYLWKSYSTKMSLNMKQSLRDARRLYDALRILPQLFIAT